MPLAILVRERLLAPVEPSLPWSAIAIAGLHGLYVLYLGVIMAPDSYVYDHYADRLVESGFAYGPILAEAEARTAFPAVLYVLFTTFVAVLKLLFGDGWAVALVAANLAAHVALGVMIVRLAVLIAGPLAGWVALLLFLGCFDLLQWVNVVSSDTTFVLLIFAVFVLAANRVLGRASAWWPVAGPALAGIFYRPTGLVLVPDLVWAWFLSKRAAPLRRMRIVLGAVGAFALAGITLFAWFVQDTSRWPFGVLAGPFEVVSAGYAVGEVVSARAETYHSPPNLLLDYLLLTFDRIAHFFSVGAASFSLGHWLVSAAFLVPCYALSLWMILMLARGTTSFDPGGRKVLIAACGAILSYAVFHGMIQVDFDWRYRTPILAEFILLASAGAVTAVRKFQGE